MSDIKVGDTVRHPARGTGTVTTLVRSPLTGRIVKAEVEFPGGFSGVPRKYLCFAEDLAPVAAPAAPARPALSVVASDQPGAA